jgi:hypothetical protein
MAAHTATAESHLLVDTAVAGPPAAVVPSEALISAGGDLPVAAVAAVEYLPLLVTR